ncbi:PilN domain-containing protein [Desulfofustis limnaeus]|uniref:Fimbrial protein n=1 Tax=Desulfofustis limnaeus TaxID=2740163 RepID=A0ABM7WCA7_9BACT|nr:PilN domain-containing protein [Desulfofustis limnaeus]BDD88572.1 fimbrial protein [Desulfofustis limnaeus]
MLKINLLPIRQLKKRAKARNQIVAALIAFCGIIVLLAFVGMLQAARISNLNDEIQAREKEKKSFDKVVQELADLEKKRLELNEKIRIINQLKTDSYLTVRILDEVANLIDNNRMWLTSLSQSGSNLTLSGYAMDNETIAQFMDELKFNSPFVNSVSLSNSSQASVSGKDLKSFSLVCSVSFPQPTKEVASEMSK